MSGGLQTSQEPACEISPSVLVKYRQAKLFEMQSCLSEKLGKSIFQSLPSCPGVYFFYDQQGQLLYIGQSGNLKARVGSYRHVSKERHPIRLRRLVSRIARLEWQECASAAEAIELERILLLECRPPFNRAGVWVGDPWFFKFSVHQGLRRVSIELSRQPETAEGIVGYGPLPSGFRYVHASLVRCFYRHWLPDVTLWQYPLGLLNLTVPLHLEIEITDNAPDEDFMRSIFEPYGDEPTTGTTMSWLDMILEKTPAAEMAYWECETETVRKFILSKRRVITKRPTASEATLEGDLFNHSR